MDDTNYGIHSMGWASERKYAMTGQDFSKFIADVLNGTIHSWSLSGLFQNDNDYLISYRYYPIDLDKFVNYGTYSTSFDVGQISVSYNNYPINTEKNYIKWFETTISREFGNFLDFEPYTKITLYCPYFESVQIPATKLVYGNTITGYLSLDLRGGYLSLFVYCNNVLLAMRRCKIAIDIPMGKSNEQEQQRNNILQAIGLTSGLISTGTGIATGNPLAVVGGVSIASHEVMKAIANNVDRLVSYTGSNGATDGLCVDKTIRIVKERPITTESQSGGYAHSYGLPLNRVMSLSSLTGFTRIGEIHFNPSNEEIYDDEVSEIVDLLQSGVIL